MLLTGHRMKMFFETASIGFIPSIDDVFLDFITSSVSFILISFTHCILSFEISSISLEENDKVWQHIVWYKKSWIKLLTRRVNIDYWKKKN